MAVLMFNGADEAYPSDDEFNEVDRGDGTAWLSSTTAYLQGRSFQPGGGSSVASYGTWARARTLQSGTDPIRIVGSMFRLETNQAGVDLYTPGAVFARGGAVVNFRRTDTGSSNTNFRVFSTGMDGTDFDETVTGVELNERETWHQIAIECRALSGGGIYMAYYLDGSLHWSNTYPSASWPAGEWEWVEHGIVQRQHPFVFLDDLYISDDFPRFGAKVVTLRPDTQGFYDDFAASAGTKPEQTNNTPPDSENISGGPGDRDTVNMDTFTPLSSLPFVEQVAYTAYGTSSADQVALVRKAGTDEDGDDLVLGSTDSVASAYMPSVPGGGAWNEDEVNDHEFGLRVL